MEGHRVRGVEPEIIRTQRTKPKGDKRRQERRYRVSWKATQRQGGKDTEHGHPYKENAQSQGDRKGGDKKRPQV